MPSARMHCTYLRTPATYWVTTSALGEPDGAPDATGPPVPAALATPGPSVPLLQPASSSSAAPTAINRLTLGNARGPGILTARVLPSAPVAPAAGPFG